MRGLECSYLIDKSTFKLTIDNADDICAGENICLAKKFDDPALRMPWSKQGWTTKSYLALCKHNELKEIVEQIVKNCIQIELPDLSLNNFSLEKYHRFIKPKDHLKIVRSTRRIYSETGITRRLDSIDFTQFLSSYYQADLGYYNKMNPNKQHIIIRINPPRSQSYNPVHKDIYGIYDYEDPKRFKR